jgi:hypothetical protein
VAEPEEERAAALPRLPWNCVVLLPQPTFTKASWPNVS